VVVLVDDAGEVCGDQVSPAGDVVAEAGGELRRDHMQDRRHDHVVWPELDADRHDVDPDAQVEEGGVPVERFLAVSQPGDGTAGR
jgi:hypothetical protein